jgi:hypothetical protein
VVVVDMRGRSGFGSALGGTDGGGKVAGGAGVGLGLSEGEMKAVSLLLAMVGG